MVDDAAVTQCFLSAAALGALIDTTQDNISRLQSALQKERGTLAQLLWMLAPIGKLPVETLVQIFKYSVQTCHEELTASESAEGRTLTRTPMQQLLTLSGVCSRWMAIINSTPELWSLHAVEVRLDRINTATRYIPVLKTLLERSAQLPISVSVTQQDPDCDTRFGFGIRTFGTSLVTETVIQAMVPTAPRWKHLTVDQASFYPLATLRGGTFRSLESLNMRYDVEPLDGSNVVSDPISTFSAAPALRRLVLSMHDKATILMPWAQLTHLSLRYAPLSGCLAICCNVALSWSSSS
ncbi:hypothetical protein C8R46DRAFT_1023408 [Mycena filopes]|nr:hypothetical protein C8R46DRAFT_1023408 [Mycena filopes]